jgi:hypothetical protein
VRTYDPNDESSIRGVFERDEEYLGREGFRLPPDLRVHADDTLPKTSTTQHMSSMTIEAYEAYLLTGRDEAF